VNNSKTILAVVLLMAGTLLTTTAVTTMVPAAYAGGDNDDGNQQKAEDDSSAGIADCDRNNVEEARFLCIAIAANDVEIEEEIAQLSVTKTVSCSSHLGAPSNEAVCNFALASDNFPDPSDYQITVTGNNLDPSSFAGSESPEVVSIGPGEYTVSEILADTSALQQELGASFIDNRSVFEGDCINSFGGTTSTTGTIAAGQSQECNIGNEINIFGGTVPDPDA
jgi:hypothetical protein